MKKETNEFNLLEKTCRFGHLCTSGCGNDFDCPCQIDHCCELTDSCEGEEFCDDHYKPKWWTLTSK